MENQQNNTMIFDLIKKQDFISIEKLITTNKMIDFDIRDNNYNYFIQYIVTYNQFKILQLILNKKDSTIRLDIMDTDGRSILYNCIKFNYIEIIEILLIYNKNNIGISIIDIKDKMSFTSLHYSIMFNNFNAFKKLLEYGADPYIRSNDGNSFILCMVWKRDKFIEYMIDKKYKLNFLTKNGETILQIAVILNKENIINMIINSPSISINLNNITNDFGLTILHHSIIFDKIDLFNKLLERDVDMNIADFQGMTCLHYIFNEKRLNFVEPFFKKYNDTRLFNVSNINGMVPLHILLNSDMSIPENIMTRILIETDLNIQDNDGITCFLKMVENNMIKKYRDILVIKPLNFFIEDIHNTKHKLTDEIIDIMVESYYNMIKLNKDELLVEWEKWCSDSDKYKKLIFDKLKKGSKLTDTEAICKMTVKDVIVNEHRSLPSIQHMKLNFDNGIFTNTCFYTGFPIDVLFGLLLLYNTFKNEELKVILDFPLTINTILENYYKKIGLDYKYNMDFSNIEILWSYQKIFYPSYFENMIEKQIKYSRYIVIPIGIETSIGSHANILFWDIMNKTIERFEPNGSNYPMGLNYNPELLDNLIENKFKEFDDITYYPPYKFLPPIGFQLLESLETDRCKKIGDPNGFCAVWCIWWVYQRMLNIMNPKLQLTNIAEEMIRYIKFDNMSFKTIIRNFSKKITEIRDSYLKKINIDINDWVVGNYNEEQLDKLEKIIYNNISQ
jgi:ankyrin repeat protein